MTDTEPVQDVEEKEIPSYADHMLKCEVYADELTRILRTRFHRCEASIFCLWQGLVILSKTAITNGLNPPDANGQQAPVTITCQARIPLPWTLPEDKRKSGEEFLNEALGSIDEGIIASCAKQGVLCLSYNAFVRRMSTTIATANEMPKLNGRGKSRILQA